MIDTTGVSRDIELAVYNWAFGQGIQPMRYDWRTDTWFMNDGEPYTTTLILREAAKLNEH